MDGSNAGERKSAASPDGSTTDPAPQEQVYESGHSSSVSSIDTMEVLNTTDADREWIANSLSDYPYVRASSQPPGQPPTRTLPDRPGGTQEGSSSTSPSKSEERGVSSVPEPNALSGHQRSLDTPFQAPPGSEPPPLLRTSGAYPHESDSEAWGHLLAAEAATRRLAEAVHTLPSQINNRLNPEAPSFMPGQGVRLPDTVQPHQEIPPQRPSFSSINDQNLARFNASDARMNALETIQVAEVRRLNRLETCLWALTFVQEYIRGVLQRREEEEAAADAGVTEVAEGGADDGEGEAAEAPNVENDTRVAEEQTDRSHDSADQ